MFHALRTRQPHGHAWCEFIVQGKPRLSVTFPSSSEV